MYLNINATGPATEDIHNHLFSFIYFDLGHSEFIWSAQEKQNYNKLVDLFINNSESFF